jgi:hypothetical protein
LGRVHTQTHYLYIGYYHRRCDPKLDVTSPNLGLARSSIVTAILGRRNVGAAYTAQTHIPIYRVLPSPLRFKLLSSAPGRVDKQGR